MIDMITHTSNARAGASAEVRARPRACAREERQAIMIIVLQNK